MFPNLGIKGKSVYLGLIGVFGEIYSKEHFLAILP